MREDWAASEQRSIRMADIISHGLHRQTNLMAWDFEQGHPPLAAPADTTARRMHLRHATRSLVCDPREVHSQLFDCLEIIGLHQA